MITSDEEIRKTVNAVYDKYDQNNDGYLTYPEVSSYINDAMMSQENRNATEEEIRLFMQTTDLDCDQKISKMELFKLLKLTVHTTWFLWQTNQSSFH